MYKRQGDRMSDKKRGLGRGLSALIGETAKQAVVPQAPKTQSSPPAVDKQGQATQTQISDGLRYLGVDQLQPGKFQPRKNFDQSELATLAASIEKSGVLQPLLVRSVAGDDGKFEIIAGERRWRAAQKAKLHQVPVIVQDINDVSALEIGIIENVQRSDLNPIEEAEGYQRLIDDFAYTQAELAETIGKSLSHIANLLRLTGAPDAVRKALVEGAISMGHARALLGVSNAAALVKKIVAEGLSVRAVEALANSDKEDSRPRAKATSAPASKNADTRALEKTITDSLGLRVSIEDKGDNKGGSVRVDYKSLDQLDALVSKLIGQ